MECYTIDARLLQKMFLAGAKNLAIVYMKEGVLFRVRPWHVVRLDFFEGAPRTYLRKMVPVTCDGRRLWCWTYMMTEATRATREGLAYPPWYRSMCSEGARQHGVRDDFAGGRGI